MRAVQVTEDLEFELIDTDVPDIASDQVLVEVEACSICHSDEFVKEATWPELELPRVPGHEIAGTVAETGAEVETFQSGEKVGVGWYGGHCGSCEACREGDFINCPNGLVTGISFEGGYAEYVAVPEEAVVPRSDELEAKYCAPLLCAGVTTYNALRNSTARSGDLVVVQGIGGLGHLGIQYADAMGHEVVALSTDSGKEAEAKGFGADHFIHSETEDPVDELGNMGGADVILATAPSGSAISSVIPALGREGELLLVGVDDHPVEFQVLNLIDGRKSISGWPCGSSIDSEETIAFSERHDIEPSIEVFPLEEAEKAYNRMIQGEINYRAVLVP